MNLPQPRDLPPGRHEVRRAHLVSEIERDAVRRRPRSRRLLTGASVVVLAGTGIAAAAAAGALHGSGPASTLTVACFDRAAISTASRTVIHPPGTDPVGACQAMWEHRLIVGPPASRPAKAGTGRPVGGPTAPPLVACSLHNGKGGTGPIGVFPGRPGTCESLGLTPAPG